MDNVDNTVEEREKRKNIVYNSVNNVNKGENMFRQRLIQIAFIGLLLIPAPTFANNEQHLIVILVPDLSFNEVETLLTYEDDVFHKGALAAMNLRPDGAYSYLNNIVSLSSGRKGVGVLDWNSFEQGEYFLGERVEVQINRWTGHVPQAGLIHPYIHKLKAKNNDTSYKGQIGLLGETLKNNGVFRYVIGHSDQGEEKVRYASLFTIDQAGESLGELHRFVKQNPIAPFGYEMNGEAIIQKIKDITRTVSRSLIVIEWGDVARLFAQKEQMTTEHFEKQYSHSLTKLSRFVDSLVDDTPHSVMLLSPNVNREAYKQKKQLAPLWYWNHQNGELYSQTTRQAQIVSNLDIAPTILHFYQIETPQEMDGFPLQVNELEKMTNRNHLLQQLDWIIMIFATRGVVLSSYITLLIILLIGTTILLWKKHMGKLWITLGKVIILAGLSSPLSFLLLSSSLKYVGVTGYFFLITLLSFLTGIILEKWIKQPLVVIGWLLFLVISIDLLLGAPLMQRSYLGYDPVIGARYYGIGNEYAGVYIMAALFVMLPFFRYGWKGYVVVYGLFIILLLFLALPMLGTNAGATLAATIALIFLLYLLFLKKHSKSLQLVILIVFGFLSISFLYMMQKFGESSHIGVAFERLLTGDFVYIVDVIKRKLAMNWKIFKYSNWTQLFVTTYILLGFFLWRYKDKFSSGENKLVLQIGIVASVALLLLNDSGVVAAATSMFLLISASYYWVLEKREALM